MSENVGVGGERKKGLILLQRQINIKKDKRFSRKEKGTGDLLFAKVTGRGM